MIRYPAGPIRTACPEGPCGIEWASISQWAQPIATACAEFGTPENRVAGHVVIESRGNPQARQVNPTYGDTFGLMQVNPRYWQATIERLSGRQYVSEAAAGQALIDDPLLALRAGCAVLRAYFDQHGSWDKASSAFFLGNPNWQGQDTVNGNTGQKYRASLNGLIAEVEAANAGTEEPPMDNRLPFRVALIPVGNYNRPRTAMNAGGPRYVTVHETGNTDTGANAEMHRRFTHNGGGPDSVSFHEVVDDKEAIQLLPFTEVGWHAGDGCDNRQTDLGCFDSIAIETCVNRDGNWEQTLRNLILLIAKNIRETPTLSADRIRQHNTWSGKNCPERLRREGRFDWLVSEVKRELAGAPAPTFQGLPAWLPADHFKAAFPSADPNGVVTKKVIEIVNDTKRVPIFLGKIDAATNRNIWRFDHFVVMNDGSRVWREGEAA